MANVIYEIGFKSSNGPQIDWVNQPDGVIKGPFHHPLGLFEHTGVGSGIPIEPEVPELHIKKIGRSKPISDFQPARGTRWYISQRAKELFERVDGSAFDFRLARTKHDGSPGPDFYICDVIRFVDGLDTKKSRVTPSASGSVTFFFDDNVFRASEIGAHLLFRLTFSPDRIMCVGAFRSAVKESGLANIAFKKIGIME